MWPVVWIAQGFPTASRYQQSSLSDDSASVSPPLPHSFVSDYFLMNLGLLEITQRFTFVTTRGSRRSSVPHCCGNSMWLSRLRPVCDQKVVGPNPVFGRMHIAPFSQADPELRPQASRSAVYTCLQGAQDRMYRREALRCACTCASEASFHFRWPQTYTRCWPAKATSWSVAVSSRSKERARWPPTSWMTGPQAVSSECRSSRPDWITQPEGDPPQHHPPQVKQQRAQKTRSRVLTWTK